MIQSMHSPLAFLHKPVAIIGMGMSGESVRKLLQFMGYQQDCMSTYDSRPGQAEYNDPQKMLKEKNPKTLIVSPGVPLASDWIQDFKESGGHITSELTIALHFLAEEKIIGITGSVGKSTTVSLLEAGLLQFSPNSFVGGNLGRPLADYVLELLQKKRKAAPWLVLELSSFQLENLEPLRCDYSAITYFTPNHMERYSSLEEYYAVKWSLLQKTTKSIVLNKNGGDLEKFSKGKKLSLPIIWTDRYDESLMPLELEGAKLLGAHNQDNLAVAIRIAKEANWPQEAIHGMLKFPGLSHRMENLGTFSGIHFVNDSKATTMESVKTAVHGIYDTMDRKNTLHVMLGGKDKNLPWEELQEFKKLQKCNFIFFGDVAALAQEKSKLDGQIFPKLSMSIVAIKQQAKAGDIVLLSPGGTSLDEFRSFEERGKIFEALVRKNFS